MTRFENLCEISVKLYLKGKVFKYCPHTLTELRDRIVEEVNALIPHHIYNRIIKNCRNGLYCSLLMLTATILG